MPAPEQRQPTPRVAYGFTVDLPILSAWDYFAIGVAFGYLKDARVGDSVCHPGGKQADELGHGFITAGIDDLVYLLEQNGIARSELPRWKQLGTYLQQKYSKYGEPYIDEADHAKVVESVLRLEPLLRRDLNGRNFTEPHLPDGLLPYQKLRNAGAKLLFTGRTYPLTVPPIVREDLDESVICLLHGLSTSGAMIALRSAEGMMREVYAQKLQKPTRGVRWKVVEDGLIAHLNSIGSPTDAGALSSHLSFLRAVRNEVEHPQERYDTDRAENALRHSVEVISLLARLT